MDDRPFDDTRTQPNHLLRTCGVYNTVLGGGVQSTPGSAFAVDELFPPERGDPQIKLGLWHTQFFEVMKLVFYPLRGQPRAGFFNGVAIGDTVNVDGF